MRSDDVRTCGSVAAACDTGSQGPTRHGDGITTGQGGSPWGTQWGHVKIQAFGRTDVGLVRNRNEDRALVGERLFVVADGLGGHNAGDVASSMLVAEMDGLDIRTFASSEEAYGALVGSIEEANRRIYHRALNEPDREGMGTTVTAGLLHGTTLLIAQVGDTRAYLKRGDGPMQQITPDHSYVGALIEAGVITAEEAKTHPKRSVILKALGQGEEIAVDPGDHVDLQPGDEVIMVSDGVHGVVSDAELEGLIHDRPLSEAVDGVIAAARDAGGPDNITIVVLRALPDG